MNYGNEQCPHHVFEESAARAGGTEPVALTNILGTYMNTNQTPKSEQWIAVARFNLDELRPSAQEKIVVSKRNPACYADLEYWMFSNMTIEELERAKKDFCLPSGFMSNDEAVRVLIHFFDEIRQAYAVWGASENFVQSDDESYAQYAQRTVDYACSDIMGTLFHSDMRDSSDFLSVYQTGEMVIDGIPVNPVLPDSFYSTPNEDRPASQEYWWNRPYIEIETINAQHSGRTSELVEVGQLHRQTTVRSPFVAPMPPSGTRYDVWCLDGGAWDRPTSWGRFATIEDALACAKSGPAWRQKQSERTS
ncbi:MAG: hypothetical protein KA740_10800 [Rhodoferax sp.]|nr:hypothetical protein [Rhodoferax sp.]